MNEVNVYLVGGAVRDRLLGLPVQDRDWVVVGQTPEAMLAMGYQQVGSDFPVFLHPTTKDECALARTERKCKPGTGALVRGRLGAIGERLECKPGYRGFAVHASPDVTLEEDLLRRDFTINAIAESERGDLIDPHGGIADLRAGILRHVGPAFGEDPVRILRAARFAARFNFTIAPETLALMRQMVGNGEVDALVPERVWQELSRGLMGAKPSRFIETLRDCGALARILPEVDALFGVPQPEKHHPEIDSGIHTLMTLDDAAKRDCALEVRFAALVHDLGKATTPADILPSHHGHELRSKDLARQLCQRLKVPSASRELGLLVAQWHTHIHKAQEMRITTLVDLLQSCDALRRPERFEQLLQACAADARGRLGHETDDYDTGYLAQAVEAMRETDTKKVVARCIEAGQQRLIHEQIRQAYISSVKAFARNFRASAPIPAPT